jgi:hypothetical protein
LLAFNVLNEVKAREKKNLITVKLFTKEEDEEKQKKVNDLNSKEKKQSDYGMDNLIWNLENCDLKSNFKDKYFNVTNTKEKTKIDNYQHYNKNIDINLDKQNINRHPGAPMTYYSKNSPKVDLSNKTNSIISSKIEQYVFNASFNTEFSNNYEQSFSPLEYNNFHIPNQQLYFLKYVTNYDIQIENDNKFKVTKRLIGNKGLILKKILFDCCIKYHDYTTKIRLRGKGSGYKEGSKNEGKLLYYILESPDPLQLCISSLNYFTYSKCCQQVEKFLEQIYYEYFNFLFTSNLLTEATPKKIVKYEYIVNRYA